MISSLSIVIPMFNEEKRILKSLLKLNYFIKKIKKKIKVQVIFVNDGSTDKTIILLKKFLIKKKINNKIVILKKNLGKGAALKTGVSYADYGWILTCDLDMSVPIDQIISWAKKNYINPNCDIYFGSRSHNNSIVYARIHRKILGNIFNFIIKKFLKIKINDTQCGYKLYKNISAKKIFKRLTINRFEHDLEIILIAKQLKKEIIELPVKWIHKSNSKLNIFTDSVKMFYGILLLSLKLRKI